MRGHPPTTGSMFYAIDIEDRIRPDHPLRPIRRIVDEILADLGPVLAACYIELGRPSVPPEVLLKALVLQCLYSVRSERQLVERLDTDLLFRWFCGLDPAEPVFDATAFTHNRPRLDAHGVTGAFFAAVRARAIDADLASNEHFSVDGTLIESHASIKSFTPIDEDNKSNDDRQDGNTFMPRNAESDFRGSKPSNPTHRSRTDPEARFYRKSGGHESRLCHMGHAVCENRHGLVMAVEVTEANGRAECAATIEMIDRLADAGVRPRTLGADRGYDSGPWMVALEERGVTPHAAMRCGRVGGAKNTSTRLVKNRPLIAARRRMKRRTRGEPYWMSQRTRKKVEEIFGWCKTIAGLGRARHMGRWKIRQQFEMAAAAYNLVRLRNLMGARPRDTHTTGPARVPSHCQINETTNARKLLQQPASNPRPNPAALPVRASTRTHPADPTTENPIHIHLVQPIQGDHPIHHETVLRGPSLFTEARVYSLKSHIFGKPKPTPDEVRFNVILPSFEPYEPDCKWHRDLTSHYFHNMPILHGGWELIVGDNKCWAVRQREIRHPIPPIDLADTRDVQSPR